MGLCLGFLKPVSSGKQPPVSRLYSNSGFFFRGGYGVFVGGRIVDRHFLVLVSFKEDAVFVFNKTDTVDKKNAVRRKDLLRCG